MITTTTDHIEGYRITEYLGVVMAHAQDHHDFNDPYYWQDRDMAGKADAIIGIQYGVARSTGVTAQLVGTAVKIEKI